MHTPVHAFTHSEFYADIVRKMVKKAELYASMTTVASLTVGWDILWPSQQVIKDCTVFFQIELTFNASTIVRKQTNYSSIITFLSFEYIRH